LLAVLAFGSTGTVFADDPAIGDYRSAASGNWNDNATWETFDGSNWVAAGSTPTSQKVTIQNSHMVDVTRRVTVDQVIVQFGGTITNAQNLSLNGSGTALDIFGTVHSEGLQTAEDGTILTNTIWPLAVSTTSIVEPGGSLAVDGGNLEVDGTLLVAGGTVTTAAGDNLSGSGTLTISNGTVTVGAPGQANDCSVQTLNMTGGLLILGRGFTPNIESLTGGTIHFTATQTGYQVPQITYSNVILSGGGNGVMNLNLGNGNTVINGNLSIMGTTVVSVQKPLTVQSLTLGGVTVGAGTWGGIASGADNINATYFALATPGDFITVIAGEELVVTLPGQVFTPGVGNTGTVSNQTAGTTFNLTIHAVGVGGTVLDTNYSGTKTITYSGPATAANGTAPSYTMNVTFTNGVASGIATTLTAAETTTITATDGTADGVTSSSLTVVAGPMDHYALNAAAPQNATYAFPLTVTTQDPFNNPVTTDSATPVTLGSSTGHASFGSNPITLTNGVFTVSTMVSTAETVNLTATDPNGKTGALALLINPAPAIGDYRSAASGNWNDNATWQTFDGSNWVAAGSTPTSQKVMIQSGDTVDVTRRVTVNQVQVQFGGTITNAQNLRLGVIGTALDIFGTVHAEGLQTTETGTIDPTTIWPLAFGSSSIVERGGSLAVEGGNLDVDGTLLVVGGTVTTASGDNLSGSGTLTISGGMVTVGAPGQANDFSVNTVNMTGGLLILGRNISPNTESLTGGTIQYTATQTGFQIIQLTYANLILSGTTMNLNLGNGNTVINGNLSITGTTLVSVRKPLTAHSLTLGGVTVGSGTWGGTGSGADNINTTYFAPATPGDFITVGASGQTITFGALSNQTYGVAPFMLNASASSGLPVAFSIVSGLASVSSNLISIAGAGVVTVSASQSGNSNYLAATPVLQSFTVTPAGLGVTANNATRAFGATNPIFTVSYSGFVNGDTVGVLSGAPVLTTGATTNSPVGSYVITNSPGTLSASNYVFNLTNGTLTVNAAATSVSLTSSPNPSDPGQEIQFTATVSAANATPIGTVILSENSTTLGTNSLSGGQATFRISSLSVGSHGITARYTGTNNFDGSTNTTSQTVNPSTVLEPIPDQTAYVLMRLVLTNRVINSNLLLQPLTFGLGAGAPPGVKIQTNNGVLSWAPTRAQARSTNAITVLMTDSGVVRATNTFNIIVDDYLELSLGQSLLQVGQTSSVPVTLVTTRGLTNLQALIQVPADHLGSLALVGVASELGSATLQQQTTDVWKMDFVSAPGQQLQGTQELAHLSFLAVPNHSAFVPLIVSEVITNLAVDGSSIWRTLTSDGRAVVVGQDSLVEALPLTNGFPNLILYGVPGVSYEMLYSPVPQAAAWQSVWQGTMPTNLSIQVSGLTNTGSTMFFRAREQ
jgi:hypothetical protein